MAGPVRSKPTEIKERTYSVLVENEPGVLSRIAGLFSARGYNIISLAVGETDDPTMSRMTIVAEGTELVLEQINKQLNKLIPVISVKNLIEGDFVSRELLLAKIENNDKVKAYLKKNVEKHPWSIIDESPEHLIIQAVASTEEIQSIMEELRQLNISEISRTGRVAMSKKYKIGVVKKRGGDHG